ncbi:MAG: gluconate 2-dehydrogenase subunit 3 family protein [Pseudohongiellaceae bacterium]
MSTIYNPKMSRRESLKRIGTMATVVMVGGVPVACDTAEPEVNQASSTPKAGHWPDIELETITGPTYGTDPIISNPTVPWPLTLSETQRDQVAVLGDIVCPADDRGPSASEVGVPDVIDEWVSAPYSNQQRDRVQIINGLQWLDDEAQRRFDSSFVAISSEQRIEIIEDIAYRSQFEIDEFELPARFFSRIRRLVFGAYFSSPEGIQDIGYIGNIPIAGDYPGPTEEAMKHIRQVADTLGLPPITEYVNR